MILLCLYDDKFTKEKQKITNLKDSRTGGYRIVNHEMKCKTYQRPQSVYRDSLFFILAVEEFPFRI